MAQTNLSVLRWRSANVVVLILAVIRAVEEEAHDEHLLVHRHTAIRAGHSEEIGDTLVHQSNQSECGISSFHRS